MTAFVDENPSGNRVSVKNVKGPDGVQLDCSAIIVLLDDETYKVELQISAGGVDSKASVQTTVRTPASHPVFIALANTHENDKPTLFVLRLSKKSR